jgi:hypothetical protein
METVLNMQWKTLVSHALMSAILVFTFREGREIMNMNSCPDFICNNINNNL